MKNELNLDIILCIDGTSSMQEIIDNVKHNSVDFITKIIDRIGYQKFEVNELRAKFIIFRDFIVDEGIALQISPFYNLRNKEEEEKFIAFINQVNAIGGGKDHEEDGLEALSVAIKSKWSKKEDSIRIIGIWSDSTMHPLEKRKKRKVKGYPKNIPKSFEELTNLWEGEFLVDDIPSKLILYTPHGYPWDNINSEWTNVIHYPSTAGIGIEVDSPEIIDDIAKNLIAIKETKVFEKLDSLPVEVKELIDERDRLRNTIANKNNEEESTKPQWLSAKWLRKATASFVLVSFAFFSFKLIGFNLFTYKYIKEQTNHYHVKYEKELEEHIEDLKEEERIEETTTINIETETEKRSGLFNQQANIEVRYVIEFDMSDFELGQYSVYKLPDTREAARIFGNHLNYLDKIYDFNNLIDVTLIGETDGSPIVNLITYRGEFGNIKNKPYYYRSELKQFSLKQKSPIKSNETLGFLRGYSLWDHLRRRVDFLIRESTNFTQIVKTNNSLGGDFRKIEIIVKIYDVKLKD